MFLYHPNHPSRTLWWSGPKTRRSSLKISSKPEGQVQRCQFISLRAWKLYKPCVPWVCMCVTETTIYSDAIPSQWLPLNLLFHRMDRRFFVTFMKAAISLEAVAQIILFLLIGNVSHQFRVCFFNDITFRLPNRAFPLPSRITFLINSLLKK